MPGVLHDKRAVWNRGESFAQGGAAEGIVGGIAHELAHIVRDHGLGPLQRDWVFERFASSRTYRSREERAADRRAVERGYGPHLIALTRFARKIGIRFERENGLLTNEIVAVHNLQMGRDLAGNHSLQVVQPRIYVGP